MTTKIEWCDYTINPVKGICPVGCSYCYARRMYKHFGWNPEIRFDWSVANDLPKIRKGSKVFWGSTIELFGEWVEPEWMRLIMEAVKRESHLTHIFLTKQPQNLVRWSPFPSNVWIGASATDYVSFSYACNHLYPAKANVKFISFEPLLTLNGFSAEVIYRWLHDTNINWVIVGRQTPLSKKTEPKIEWIREIVEGADKLGIPIFLKNNLWELLFHSEQVVYNDPFWQKNGKYELRQEFPAE